MQQYLPGLDQNGKGKLCKICDFDCEEVQRNVGFNIGKCNIQI